MNLNSIPFSLKKDKRPWNPVKSMLVKAVLMNSHG